MLSAKLLEIQQTPKRGGAVAMCAGGREILHMHKEHWWQRVVAWHLRAWQGKHVRPVKRTQGFSGGHPTTANVTAVTGHCRLRLHRMW